MTYDTPEELAAWRSQGLRKAADVRRLGAMWQRALSVDVFPDTYRGRDEWIAAFRGYGFTIDDKPARPPWSAPVFLYRGAGRNSTDGIAWTPDPAVAAVFAFAPWFATMSRAAGKVWQAVVTPDRVLAVLTYEAPVIGPWAEIIVDTADMEIRPLPDETQTSLRDTIEAYLTGPIAPEALRAFGMDTPAMPSRGVIA